MATHLQPKALARVRQAGSGGPWKRCHRCSTQKREGSAESIPSRPKCSWGLRILEVYRPSAAEKACEAGTLHHFHRQTTTLLSVQTSSVLYVPPWNHPRGTDIFPGPREGIAVGLGSYCCAQPEPIGRPEGVARAAGFCADWTTRQGSQTPGNGRGAVDERGLSGAGPIGGSLGVFRAVPVSLPAAVAETTGRRQRSLPQQSQRSPTNYLVSCWPKRSLRVTALTAGLR